MNDQRWAIVICVGIIAILVGVYLMAQASSWEMFLNRFLAAGITMVVSPVAAYFILKRGEPKSQSE